MRLTLLLLLTLALSACQLWQQGPLYYPYAGGGYQLQTRWPGPSQQLLQQVQFAAGARQQEFLLSVQLLPEQILLVALSPLGHELGRVELTAGGRLQQQGQAPFSDRSFAVQLLAQMQWSLWPLTQIQPGLDDLQITQQQQQRLLLDKNAQAVLTINGAGPLTTGQVTEISQPDYRLRLTTVQQDFL